MQLEEAIEILKKAVKFTGKIDQKHIDLTIVPAKYRPVFQQALAVSQTSIKDGKISRDEFMRRIHLS